MYGMFGEPTPKKIRAYCYRNVGKVRFFWNKERECEEEKVLTPEECEARFRRVCNRQYPNHRSRVGCDTRRRKWKLLGEHHGQQWSGDGKYYKTRLNQMERRAAKRYTKTFEGRCCEEAENLGLDTDLLYGRGHDCLYGTVSWRNT
jgi:hypothetical protein